MFGYKCRNTSNSPPNYKKQKGEILPFEKFDAANIRQFK